MSFLQLGLILGVATALILLGVALFLKTFRFRTKAQSVEVHLTKGEEFDALREDGLIAVRLSYEHSTLGGRVIQTNRRFLRWRIPLVGSRQTMLVDPEKPRSLQLPGIREY